MDDDSFSAYIASWLSQVHSDYSDQSSPTHSITHIKSTSSRKRKRSPSVDRIPTEPVLLPSSKRVALTQVNVNCLPKINRIPVSQNRVLVAKHNIPGFDLIADNLQHGMADPSSIQTPTNKKRKGSIDPSSPAPPEQSTAEIAIVRRSMAEEGLRFLDKTSFRKYPEFKAKIKELVMGDRASTMRPQSKRAIKEFMANNVLTPEVTYFTEAKSLMIKVDGRGVEVEGSKMKTFVGEALEQVRTFEPSDRIVFRRDILFVKKALPRQKQGFQPGMSTPKPDWVFGLAEPGFADDDTINNLHLATKEWVYCAPQVRHAWFAIDNKSAREPIAFAETQALRTGAALVNAHRQLLQKAGMLKKAPGDDKLEAPGADEQSFKFTCCWIPEMANIYVHWHERLPNGKELWHMNLVRGYLFSCKGHLRAFRADIHNILDCGVMQSRAGIFDRMLEKVLDQERQNPSTAGSNEDPTPAILSA